MRILRISLAVLIYFSTTLAIPQRALGETETTSEKNGRSIPTGAFAPLPKICFPTSRLELIEAYNSQIRVYQSQRWQLESLQIEQFKKKIIYSIYSKSRQNEPLRDIAKQYISIGEFEQALSIIESIKEVFFQAEILTAIAESYTQAEQQQFAINTISQAVDLVENIENSSQKEGVLLYITDVYLQVADSYLKLGETELASEVISLASQTIEDIETESFKKYLLSQIALKLSTVGRIEEALAITDNLDQDRKDFILEQIAIDSVNFNQFDQALEIYQALDQYPRNEILVQIVVELASLGQFERAMAIAEDFPEKQNVVVANVAQQYINQGESNLAIGIVKDVENYCVRSNTFQKLSSLLLEAEEYSLALEITDNIEDAGIKNNALNRVAIKLAEIEKYEQAITVTQSIEDSNDKADALIRISQKLIEAGKSEQASELLSQALEIVQSSPLPTRFIPAPPPRVSPTPPRVPPTLPRVPLPQIPELKPLQPNN